MASLDSPTPSWQDRDFLSFFEAVPDALLLVDAEGVIALTNQHAESLFGYTRDELVGELVERLVAPRFRSEHMDHRKMYFKQPTLRPMGGGLTLFAVRKDNVEVAVEISLSPVTISGQTYALCAVRDVRARKAAECELETAREELDTHQVLVALLSHLPGMAYRCWNDRDWTMQFVSDGCLQLTGHRSTTFLSRGVSYGRDVIHPEDQERVWNEIQLAIGRGNVFELRYRIVAAGGKEKIVWERGVGLPSLGGESMSLQGFVHDVTRETLAERKLREFEKSANDQSRLADIGAITAKIVHDLGNPLAGLLMQTQLLVRRAKRSGTSEILEPAENVLATGRHLDAMMMEFRDFLRSQRLSLSQVDVDQFLDEVASQWESVAKQQNTAWAVEVEPGMPKLRADVSKLRRVLDNLVKNALEALKESGKVVLSAFAEAGSLCITVRDSGPGLDPSLDPFQMFETTKPEGTGMGLAVCREIAQAHNGTLEATRSMEGGAEFRLLLPWRGPAG